MLSLWLGKLDPPLAETTLSHTGLPTLLPPAKATAHQVTPSPPSACIHEADAQTILDMKDCFYHK